MAYIEFIKDDHTYTATCNDIDTLKKFIQRGGMDDVLQVGKITCDDKELLEEIEHVLFQSATIKPIEKRIGDVHITAELDTINSDGECYQSRYFNITVNSDSDDLCEKVHNKISEQIIDEKLFKFVGCPSSGYGEYYDAIYFSCCTTKTIKLFRKLFFKACRNLDI